MAKQTKTYKHHYPSDLTDKQWTALEPLLNLDPDEPARVYSIRDVLDAIFYLNRTGCAWRYLPSDLPPWQNYCLTSVIRSEKPPFWALSSTSRQRTQI